MTRSAVYCRISQDRDGEGLGVARQEKDCRALARRRGWEVVEVFVDNDTSAFSTVRRHKPRPAYERMIESIKSAEIGAVVVWHPDRLHRSPVNGLRF